MDILETSQIIDIINKKFNNINTDLTFQGYSNGATKSNNILLIYQFTGNIFQFSNVLSDINLFLFTLNGNKYNIYLINGLENQKLSIKIYITLNFE